MSRTLIIAEHDGQTLNPSTAKCAQCAAAIGHDYDIVVIGSSVEGIATEAAAIGGTGKVLAVEAGHLANSLAPNFAAEVVAPHPVQVRARDHLLSPGGQSRDESEKGRSRQGRNHRVRATKHRRGEAFRPQHGE